MLLSLWRGSKSDAQRAVLRMEEMRDALRAREMSPYVRGLAWRVGEIVWVKWTAQGEQLAGRVWRRTTGEITEVLSDGSLCIFWPSDDGDLVLDAKTVRERVVHAGVVGPRPDLAGLELVGHRIRVYWPYRCARGYGEDRVFAGRVVACDAASGAHLVLYDDGEELWEELGGSLAPRYCLEGWDAE